MRFSSLGENLFNGLEEVTVALYPEVKRCRDFLRASGVDAVLMSGSGPSVFGLVHSRAQAERAARAARRAEPSWRVYTARTV